MFAVRFLHGEWGAFWLGGDYVCIAVPLNAEVFAAALSDVPLVFTS